MSVVVEKAKAILKKYEGKTYVDTSLVEEQISIVQEQLLKMQEQLLNGVVLRRKPCNGPCACTGACMPKEFLELQKKIYDMYNELIYKQ